MNLRINGQSTSDASREERLEEERQQICLHHQTCQIAGSPCAKKDRIVYIENSSNVGRAPFVIEEVSTVQELIEQICILYPEIRLDCIQLRVFNGRMGYIHRIEYTEYLPKEQDILHIYVSLRKHPPLQYGKIEQK